MSELHKKGLLELAEMNPVLQGVYEAAQERIKNHFRKREALAALRLSSGDRRSSS